MRLWGVSMVRNEADVIEAFVRHNLGVLDGLAIVDHGSFDGTTEILAELQREDLSLRIVRDDDGRLKAIVEDADANDAQRAIGEVNSSIYVFRSSALWPALDKLEPKPMTAAGRRSRSSPSPARTPPVSTSVVRATANGLRPRNVSLGTIWVARAGNAPP